MDKSQVRNLGIEAVNVRGVVMHPECRTDEETKLTIIFLREAPDDNCPRCGNSLKETPKG